MAREFPSPESIEGFIRSNWVYVPDPPEVEFIRWPMFQLLWFLNNGMLEGDCDDATTLAGALVKAQGYPCSFIAFRLPDESEFSHVFLRCAMGAYLLDIDPIVSSNWLPLDLEAMGAEVMELTL